MGAAALDDVTVLVNVNYEINLGMEKHVPRGGQAQRN